MRSPERLTELLESTEAQLLSIMRQRDEAMKRVEYLESFLMPVISEKQIRMIQAIQMANAYTWAPR